MLRYPQFVGNESKIKGIVFRIIEEDPAEHTSRLDLDAARDLELALMRSIFINRSEHYVRGLISLIENYTTTASYDGLRFEVLRPSHRSYRKLLDAAGDIGGAKAS